ncbi:MAG: 50S ribosomal protein L9 [Candidatus Peregrinibacteria bacterium]
MPMEIILLQDVPGVGKKNDLLLVGEGYALNFLLPHQKALVATPVVRRRYAEAIRKRAEERELEKKLKTGAAAALSGKEVVFSRKATKTGKLYAAITEKHIAEALEDQHAMKISPDTIELKEHIKALGTFEATIRANEASFTLKVTVKQEK